MVKDKKYINITEIKKPNMTVHKTDMNITKIDKYKKTTITTTITKKKPQTEQQLFDKAQNRHDFTDRHY